VFQEGISAFPERPTGGLSSATWATAIRITLAKELDGMIKVNRTIFACGLAGLFAIGLCLTSGCSGPDYEGPERAAVEGKVTFDGSPLPYGTISFIADGEGRTANGLVVDGSYAISEGQGPNLGKYKVRILGYDKAPSSGGEDEGELEEDEGESEGDEMAEGESVGAQILPEKYNAATELQVEIQSGKNTHDFPLTSG
jgi:hypothetical protein